jgi:hypothetical protein
MQPLPGEEWLPEGGNDSTAEIRLEAAAAAWLTRKYCHPSPPAPPFSSPFPSLHLPFLVLPERALLDATEKTMRKNKW